jgi:hypothetical protein
METIIKNTIKNFKGNEYYKNFIGELEKEWTVK